ARFTLCFKTASVFMLPCAGLAFTHEVVSFHSLFVSRPYIISKKESSSKVPSTTLQAYSYISSKLVLVCVPAVVIITSNGCSREDCDCFMTSYKLRSCME